ncbi:recombinase family protein [Ligilactobacillus sp. LYQ135]
MKIGYARVFTADQNLARQIAKLNKVGVERIYQEKISGKDMRRPQLG